MNSKAERKDSYNSTFDGWTQEQKNKYFDRMKKITFKEREKEIIARLKNKTTSTNSSINKSKVRKTDNSIFWDKELKKLELEKKCLKRNLSPIEYSGNYKNVYKVLLI
jgi:hypothetical protein